LRSNGENRILILGIKTINYIVFEDFDMKKIAGIDYSINYPSITVNDNGKFHFYCFAEKLPKKLSFADGYTLKKFEKCGDNILNASLVAKNIVKILQSHNVTCCNLEGYAFQSVSKSLIQIGEATGILKLYLLQAGIKINIVSPVEVKKKAGGGGFKKFDMFQSFLQQENLKDNLFWQNCVKHENELYTYNQDKSIIKGIKKPIEDIIDSFYLSII